MNWYWIWPFPVVSSTGLSTYCCCPTPGPDCGYPAAMCGAGVVAANPVVHRLGSAGKADDIIGMAVGGTMTVAGPVLGVVAGVAACSTPPPRAAMDRSLAAVAGEAPGVVSMFTAEGILTVVAPAVWAGPGQDPPPGSTVALVACRVAMPAVMGDSILGANTVSTIAMVTPIWSACRGAVAPV